jgi:hypothetical protein
MPRHPDLGSSVEGAEVTRTTPGFGLLHDFRQRAPFMQSSASDSVECLAQIEEAEALGYQSLWLAEYHFTRDGFRCGWPSTPPW